MHTTPISRQRAKYFEQRGFFTLFGSEQYDLKRANETLQSPYGLSKKQKTDLGATPTERSRL